MGRNYKSAPRLKLWNSEVQKSPQIVKFRNRGHRLPRRSLRGQKRSSGQCYISLAQIFIIVENHPPCIIVILHCNISHLNLNPGATFHVLFSGKNHRPRFAGQHLQVFEPDRDRLLRTEIPGQRKPNGRFFYFTKLSSHISINPICVYVTHLILYF